MQFHRTELLSDLPKTLEINCVRTDRSLDHAGLVANVDEQAAKLRNALRGRTGRVVVAVNDPIDCLVSLFAVWVAGACAVMVNPKITQNERLRVINKTGACMWIDDQGHYTCETTTTQTQLLDDAALILMTSGTTGDPKGVTHSLSKLKERLVENARAIGPDVLEMSLCTLPLFFGHGLIGNTLTPLFAGKTLFLWPGLQIHELPQFGPTIDRLGVTFFSSVPSFWRMVLATSAPPKNPLQRVHIGSAPLSQQLWSKIIEWTGTSEVYNTYGMTETANWISGGTLADSNGCDGYVGSPWGGKFRVLKDGVLHESGQGEVAVKSPGQMLGLWSDPEQTDALIIDGFMRTGDIGDLHADQSLHLVGRSKHEINVGGIKVLAEEIDMLLEQHPGVIEACGFGIPDEIAGEVLAAVVKVRSVTLTSSELLLWCRQNARADAVPKRIEIVDDIPKTDRGKIARVDVKERMVAKWL
jgi:acyl-CoA synthetase (AMP-forming)/AMP-acid ligase II